MLSLSISLRDTYILLAVDLDTEQAIGEWIDNDMCIIELTRNGGRIVIRAVLRIDNMHNVVADVSFLVDLLRVRGVGRHRRDLVEDHLHDGVGKVRRRLAGREVWVQATEVAAVRGNVNLHARIGGSVCVLHRVREGARAYRPTNAADKLGVEWRLGVVAEDDLLIVLAMLDVDHANLEHLASRPGNQASEATALQRADGERERERERENGREMAVP